MLGLGLGMAISCSDGKFSSSTGTKKSFNKKIQSNSDASQAQGANSSGAIGDALSEANFLFGPINSPADFLFVMDNSVSMDTVLKPTLNGLLKLSSPDWPIDSMIGVITTMPSRLDDYTRVHQDVDKVDYPGVIDKEPGFLSLVDDASIKDFLAVSPTNSSYKMRGCSGWFKPGELNPDGAPCFAAHFQSPLHAVFVEAGLTAIKQFAEKNSSKAIFRPNAFVHLVIVSDANDPGGDSKELLQIRPNFAAIKSAIYKSNAIAGLKLHGIIPFRVCGPETQRMPQLLGVYEKEIDASGGIKLDICTATDYSPLLKKIATSSSPEPKFQLPENVSEIVKILVDGVQYRGKVESLAPNLISFPELDPKINVKVTIQYRG